MESRSKKVYIIFFWILVCITTTTESTTTGENDDEGNNEIQETLKLLKEGDEKIRLVEEYKNVILVLGTSGSGKSTFIQWMAGENVEVISKKINGEFIIEDGNRRIGNSSTKSMTTFPELIVERKTNSSFYDCPGFSDTRKVSLNIATTYFIKRVTDHADSVKMVFIVSYDAVRHGVDRHKFMTLVKHATEFLKDVDKYKNSIAMVVTKVENSYIKGVLVPSKTIIKGIVNFMTTVRDHLIGVSNSTSNEKKGFNERAVKFIDALLVSKGEEYLRIAIFRRPNEPGPINDIPLLQEGKSHTELVIYQNLQFTKRGKNDFSYTISPHSKFVIYGLVQNINKETSAAIEQITNRIFHYFQEVVSNITEKTNNFSTDTKIINSDHSHTKYLIEIVKNGIIDIGHLISDVKNDSFSNLTNVMEKIVRTYGIQECEENLTQILNNSRYLDLLQEVLSDKKLKKNSWDTMIYPIEKVLSKASTEISTVIKTSVKGVNDNFFSEFKKIMDVIEAHYRNEAQNLQQKLQNLTGALNYDKGFQNNIKDIYNNFTMGYSLFQNLLYEIKNITGEQLFQTLQKYLIDSGIDEGGKFLYTILDNLKYLKFLENLGAQKDKGRSYTILAYPVNVTLTNLLGDVEKDIQSSASRIIEFVQLIVKDLADAIELHFQKLFESSEIQNLGDELWSINSALLNIIKETENLKSAEELSNKLEFFLVNYKLGMRNHTFKIKNAWKNLIFLKSVKSDLNLEIWAQSWVNQFHKTTKFLSDNAEWYYYINKLYDMLSGYDVQRDISKFDVFDVENWGRGEGHEGIHITRRNFRRFLRMTKGCMRHTNTESLEATDLRVNELNTLLYITLKSKFTTTCQPGLVILGEYIMFSDFMHDGRLKYDCPGPTITIVALHTLFVDRDLIAVGEKLKVIIIAPRWEIVGNRVINLNGVDAKNHNPEKAFSRETRSEDGKPGLPGGAAGSLYGVGMEFVNSQGLTITADGGRGGRGQDGGDGLEGKKGRTPPTSDDFYNNCPDCYCTKNNLVGRDKYKKDFRGFHYEAVSNENVGGQVLFGILTLGIGPAVTGNALDIDITVFGERGDDGSYPGNGGIGGYGGKPGDVEINVLGGFSQTKVSHRIGDTGTNGTGGLGGKGGKHGKNVKVHCNLLVFRSEWRVLNSEADPRVGISRRKGLAGGNLIDRKEPEEIIYINDIKSQVGFFKFAFSKGLSDSSKIFRKNQLGKFLEALEKTNY